MRVYSGHVNVLTESFNYVNNLEINKNIIYIICFYKFFI